MALQAGTNVGPYRIEAPLGAGGVGEVYRAWDTRLKRAVASLNHPNVLAVQDLGTRLETPYVVFELLEGETLKERLACGALPLRKVVEPPRRRPALETGHPLNWRNDLEGYDRAERG